MPNITVVSPAPIEGSGGIRTILTYAKSLESAGHSVTISFLPDGKPLGDDLTSLIERTYGISGLIARVFPDGLSGADLAIATRWDTPRAIRTHFSGKLIHLIQDIEGWFNPVGDAYLTAENNFLFDSHFITLGHWLAKKQQSDYGVPAYTMDFGYDAATYQNVTPYAMRDKRICFIYQPEKPRRCTQIGIEALGIVKHSFPEYDIAFYGNNSPASLWYPVSNLGIVPPATLSELYNSSRVGLCISASNPSRIPFEMTACGLPVVDIFRGNNLHDYGANDGISLAHQTPESIAHAICTILEDEQTGLRMSQEAATFAQSRSLEAETRQFSDYVQKILHDVHPPARHDMSPRYTARPVIADSYDVTRARAFCDRQTQEFAAESATGTQHAPSNAVAVETLTAAEMTSTRPADFQWDILSTPHGSTVETHPTGSEPVTAVIAKALPHNVSRVSAIVRTAHAQAGSFEYAYCLMPSQPDRDAIVMPSAKDWTGPRGSGWTRVPADRDADITLELPAPTSEAMDIHVAVRVPKGGSTAFGWCRWLGFSFLKAGEMEDVA